MAQLSKLSRKELENYTKRLERQIEKVFNALLDGKPNKARRILSAPS